MKNSKITVCKRASQLTCSFYYTSLERGKLIYQKRTKILVIRFFELEINIIFI